MPASVAYGSERVWSQGRGGVVSLNPWMRHRHMGVIGGERKRVCVSVVGFDPVISGPLLPESVRRTHGCRRIVHVMSHRAFPVKAAPLSLYRHRLWGRSTDACQPASGRHRSDSGPCAVAEGSAGAAGHRGGGPARS